MLWAGIGLIVSLYITACHARWMIARHFGQPWRLMGPILLLDSWDHMRCSGWCGWWRVLVASWLAIGVAMIISGVVT